MVLRCILLLFLISVGLAQKNCYRKGVRAVFPAPVFSTGDNLSFEQCGIWDKQKNGPSPWLGVIRPSGRGGCHATLMSPTSLLLHGCGWRAEEFANSENKEDWRAELGKCVPSNSDKVKCLENGEGQILKVKNVTKLNAPGILSDLHIWKIEKAKFKENFIAPICISNKGNGRDFEGMQQYTAFYRNWDKYEQDSAELKEDFGPCLDQSRDFKTCEKVHENFLCANLTQEQGWMEFLTHEGMARGKNRHFLRAFQVEGYYWSSAKFYCDIFPLLDQIVSLSGDIPINAQLTSRVKGTS